MFISLLSGGCAIFGKGDHEVPENCALPKKMTWLVMCELCKEFQKRWPGFRKTMQPEWTETMTRRLRNMLYNVQQQQIKTVRPEWVEELCFNQPGGPGHLPKTKKRPAAPAVDYFCGWDPELMLGWRVKATLNKKAVCVCCWCFSILFHI